MSLRPGSVIPFASSMKPQPKANRRWDVFVSYTQRDIEFARRTKQILERSGWKPFLAHDDLNEQIGSAEWSSAVDRAIDESGCLALVVTPRSLESKWVEYEWRSVHTEILNRRPGMLIPCCWEEIGPEDFPRALRRYQAVDFRESQDQSGEALLDLVEGYLQRPIGRKVSQQLVRVLSIDGGGIKGLVTLKVLEALEEKLTQRQGGEPALLRDYFDLITGSSIGTLMTCLLSHPEKGRVSDVIEAMTKFAPKVLKRTPMGPLRLVFANSYFPGKVLNQSIESIFSDTKLGDLQTHCILPTYDVLTGQLRHFTSRKEEEKELLVKDVLRATLAVPLYFPAATVEGNELIDAAIIVNNLSKVAFDEVRRTFPNRPLTSEIALLSMGNVSLGPIGSTRDWKAVQWIGTSIDLAIYGASDHIADIMRSTFESANALDQYLRIEAEQPADEKFDFYDASPKAVERLLELGRTTAAKYDNMLEQFADLLVNGKQVDAGNLPTEETPELTTRGLE